MAKINPYPPVRALVLPVGDRPAPAQKKQRYLTFHLAPTGNILDSDLLPDVLDSDGNIVGYLDSERIRITNTTTVVDVGDSPNSNSGDPLRLAFIKINNFMEASYWTNRRVAEDLHDLDRGIYRLDQSDSDIYYRLDAVDSDLRELFKRTDSDDIEIQALKTYLENLLDSEYGASREFDYYLENRLDSDEIAIQALSTRLTKSVSTPDSSFPVVTSDGLLFFKTDDRGLYIYDDVGASGWVQIGMLGLNTGTNLWQFQTDGGTF